MNAFRSIHARFLDLPIKGKMMLVTITASLIALFASVGGLYVFQLRNFRENYQRELQTLAQIMADNCAAPLAFHDEKTAAEVLAPLRVKTELEHAAVLGKNGEVFAAFGDRDRCPPPKPDAQPGIVDRGTVWMVVQPILLDGERIGTFFMDVDYGRPLRELQDLYLEVTTGVLVGSLILVALLTLGLQDLIVQPIQSLADASKAVAKDRDYSVRVTPSGADELGQLTEAFNAMLARIEEQDDALRLSHQKLMETSRLAGMAEVATGVLHNVGNVLNSVNVSSDLVLEKLHRSKAPNLAKAADLLSRNEADLANFLTQNEVGQKLPAYLSKLGEHLAAENSELLSEVERLARHIHHVKQVVAMQQSYAKVSGVFEDLRVEPLVEDALSMNESLFSKQNIAIDRQFSPVPIVRADRHRVLQILVNLLHNAHYALAGCERTDKRVTLGISLAGDSVQITITDNGAGISPENLTRIFAHGFTTRQEGHGFGLHSGALAAREMGGALSVHSDGTGLGATFTLTLPITQSLTRP